MTATPTKAALRAAHRWAASVLEGALGNGDHDETMGDPEVVAAIEQLVRAHVALSQIPLSGAEAA